MYAFNKTNYNRILNEIHAERTNVQIYTRLEYAYATSSLLFISIFWTNEERVLSYTCSF